MDLDRQPVFEIQKQGDACIVRIRGRLATGAVHESLASKAQTIKLLGCRSVVADIRDLDAVGSSGVGFFVDLHTWATRAGGCFVLAAPSPHVSEVLSLTGLSNIFQIASDLDRALAICALNAEKPKHAGSSGA